MGCLSDREKGPPEETAKWDFITLSDFRCTSAWTGAAYVWLWFLALVGVAVYVVDTYTAVNLLAFDRWSSKVQPKLDFKYSKWIFAGCILLSWTLCVYEWIRAVRVIRRGGVAESFLDPLAVNIQSMRSKGWKRFLVFTELTKSKKGADYVALFVYFSFKTAVRVILAEGPRQVVNALTLYAVMQAELLPGGEEQTRNNFDQFWFNVQKLADENKQQAVVYFAMLFTLVIWVFSALSLFISVVLYLTFLWHYIPQRDGRLSVYCRRKIDRRLAKIVEYKVKAAIEKEERDQQKAERKAELQRQKTGEFTPPLQAALKKQPTLPDIGGTTPHAEKEDKLPDFPLVRHDTSATVATLPPYSSRPPTRNGQRQPTLPTIDTNVHPGMTRSGTQSSGWSAAPSYSSKNYATNAPLLSNAGYGGGDFPMPPLAVTRQPSQESFDAFHGRTDSQGSQDSRRAFPPGPGPRAQTPMSARPYTPGGGYPGAPPRIPLPVRSNTAFSFDQAPRSATPQDPYNKPLPHGPPLRSNTADGFRPAPHAQQDSYSSLHSQRSFSRPMPARHGSPANFTRPYAPPTTTIPEMPRTPSPESYEMQPQPAHTLPSQGGYVAFNPAAHAVVPSPTLQQGPRRNITVTGGAGARDYFGDAAGNVPQRSATAPIPVAPITPRHSNYDGILDAYDSSEGGNSRDPSPPAGPERRGTAGPHNGQGQWQAF